MNERLRQLEPLFHPSGVGFHFAIPALFKSDIIEDFVSSLHGFLTGHTGQLSQIGSEGNRIQLRNETVILRHITHIAAYFSLLCLDVIIEDTTLAVIRRKKSQHDADQCAFSGTVGPQKSDGSLVQI